MIEDMTPYTRVRFDMTKEMYTSRVVVLESATFAAN
jgi:hypothetical protein